MVSTVQVTFIDHEGTSHAVAVELEQSLMEAAVIEGVPGILAECGGVPQCGSCSVEVAEEWLNILGACSDDEASVLRVNGKLSTNRRLCCQLIARSDWDGLIVHIPEKQY